MEFSIEVVVFLGRNSSLMAKAEVVGHGLFGIAGFMGLGVIGRLHAGSADIHALQTDRPPVNEQAEGAVTPPPDIVRRGVQHGPVFGIGEI